MTCENGFATLNCWLWPGKLNWRFAIAFGVISREASDTCEKDSVATNCADKNEVVGGLIELKLHRRVVALVVPHIFPCKFYSTLIHGLELEPTLHPADHPIFASKRFLRADGFTFRDGYLSQVLLQSCFQKIHTLGQSS